MNKKCKNCKSLFIFNDNRQRFVGTGCLEYGVILSVAKSDNCDIGFTPKERMLERLPCLTKVKAEQIVQNYEHFTVVGVIDKEAALLAVKEAYKQGFEDGQEQIT